MPTVRKALCDPLPEVRKSAAQTFNNLYKTIGSRALHDIIPDLLEQLVSSWMKKWWVPVGYPTQNPLPHPPHPMLRLLVMLYFMAIKWRSADRICPARLSHPVRQPILTDYRFHLTSDLLTRNMLAETSLVYGSKPLWSYALVQFPVSNRILRKSAD